jgi:prepilin-type N-terminal cleavage/methylation domain-containing protein
MICLTTLRSAWEQTRARTKCPVLRAFTLIELLVVIAIVAILIAILLPALSKARLLGFQTRELTAARSLMQAFELYANDHRGMILPGSPTAAMVNGPMVVTDNTGARLPMTAAQRYPWRIAPWLDSNFNALYQDNRLLREIRDDEPTYRSIGVNANYVMSLFPSLGMNIVFVGGSDRHLGFDNRAINTFGPFYVRRNDEVRRPSELMVFCSARAELQEWYAKIGRPEGFFKVEPPFFTSTQGPRWSAIYDPRTEQPGPNSGFVSLRHSGKAVTARADGSIKMLDWTGLNDMRVWANQADTRDWSIQRR